MHKYIGIEKLDIYALHKLMFAIYVDVHDKSRNKLVKHIHIKDAGLDFIPMDEQIEKNSVNEVTPFFENTRFSLFLILLFYDPPDLGDFF